MDGKEAAAAAAPAESSNAGASTEQEVAGADAQPGSNNNEAASSSAGAASDSESSASGDRQPEASPELHLPSKRVYIGNLAWSVTWQMLKDLCKSKGLEVTRTDIMTTVDGRSKGCGIVEFATHEDAQQAVLTLNDCELAGRQIFVREDREQPRNNNVGRFSMDEQAKSRRVYIGNLSWDVKWQTLKDHMRQAGEVVHAEVITEHTGRSKGCGIVEYATAEGAQEAIATLSDTDLNGRMIFVREDRESSQGGGRIQNSSVYVWNLSPETTWQELKDHMRKAGNVDSATIMMNAKGESIGCGVAVYQRPQEAARAIRELQNTKLNGVPIYVREDRVQPGRGGGAGGGRGHHRPYHGHGGGGPGRGGGRGGGGEGTQLFVGNLSYETTWRELRDHFRQCGDVKRADVKTHQDGHPKGFGTVQFYNKADAEEAISRLDGSELQGRELEVRLDHKARY